MEQIVNEKGELVLKRTAYMQFLMTTTYNQMVVNALLSRTLNNAWEQAIAERLFTDVYEQQNQQAFEILDLTGDIEYTTRKTFLKAAFLITKSKANT